MPTWFTPLAQWLALPEVGLTTVFVVAFVSATLLPLGSEPAVYAYVKVSPDMFWPAILIATADFLKKWWIVMLLVLAVLMPLLAIFWRGFSADWPR